MRFNVLGPMHIRGQNADVILHGQRERRVLAALLSNVNRPVARSRLIWTCWDDPPATARRQVLNCVWGLRRRLESAGGHAVIVTTVDGYQINLRPGEFDVEEFRGKVAAALSAGVTPVDAVDRLRSALCLWRGSALDGVTGTAAETWAAKLNEEHAAAVEHCLDLELALGHHRRAVAELTELVAEHPLRERLVWLLMTALYRCGRQADALEAYRRMVVCLADLGIEPTPQLRQRQLSILRNDPRLELVAPGLR